MLKLNGEIIESNLDREGLFSLTTNATLPLPIRAQKSYIINEPSSIPVNFPHYIIFDDCKEALPQPSKFTRLGSEFDYLGNDDVIKISRSGNLKTLFRASSNHNSILLTEQCDNYCLMCSQPPKNHDDSAILQEVSRLIPLIPRHTQSLGITGGEPTIFGNRFIDIIMLMKNWLPNTGIHILSNGRKFSDFLFCQKYAEINHPNMMVGIPVYSDDPARHDYVVQAKGAFDETIRGILNLKKLNQRVELRIVIHGQTYGGLSSLAEFITRNLLFIDHVALMGLEMTGFTMANLDSLWIDPFLYKDELSEAVNILKSYDMNVSVYNHQLCLVNQDIEDVYVKSISDWKNEFPQECNNCNRINDCGGFFSFGLKNGYSKFIRPFQS